jgi:uncharacterized protein (DUF488 family)
LARPLKLPATSRAARTQRKANWNAGRTVVGADFFTLGYEGRSIDQLLDALCSARVQCMIDIRYNAVSMFRPELSKSNLAKAVTSIGVQYLHLRDWSVPKTVRARAVESGNLDLIWDWYDENVIASLFAPDLQRFFDVGEHPVAMMCVECNPEDCHRHRIFLALEEHGLRGYDL